MFNTYVYVKYLDFSFIYKYFMAKISYYKDRKICWVICTRSILGTQSAHKKWNRLSGNKKHTSN